jgi:L-ascorbate metabolism protein UlaG (beta-lactamase superfamily)
MASVAITWLGHAAFQLEWAGKVVLIDPFITGNPKSPLRSPSEIAARRRGVRVTRARGPWV